MPPLLTELSRLVQRARQGDQVAYQALILRYLHQVFITVYNIVHNYDEAEDLAQETFIKAWGALRTLQAPEKFPGWLLEIARNSTLDWLKARGKREQVSLDTLKESSSKDGTPRRLAPEVERILDEIQKLPNDYQEIMVMRYIHNLSYKEIAQKLEMPISGVGEKLWRIRQMLKERLTHTDNP